MRLILFLVLAFTWMRSTAQDATTISVDTTYHIKTNKDTATIETRSFGEARLDQLRHDSDFDYKQPPSVAESLWDRFLQWINEFFDWLFRGAVSTNWGQVLMYALGLIVLIILVMMLLKVDAFRVLYRGADSGILQAQVLDEDIHAMNFESLIADALGKREYRLAVRLTFLQALKLLSDQHHIDWRPGKTNHDYLAELKEGELKTGFNELSFYFDYAWYGDFAINENLYARVHGIFNQWRSRLS